jgi:CubicO group peptidase (beta-lactamase class C family)
MNTLKANRIFIALIYLTLMLALTIGNVNASSKLPEDADFAAIDAYVTEQMNNLGIPGMALAIVQGDQIAHLQGFGVADSFGRKVTPQTPFYIASVTKSFTALAVMQLVEAGKIDLDAPVQMYLPWFELADKEASAKITVRDLLNHTTGISEEDGNRYELLGLQGLEETVRGLGNLSLTQPVGTTWEYSNLNYMIAGLIVEKVGGQSYGDYVTQHIFGPLDMRHSYASRSSALADGLSEGYRYMFGHTFRDERVLPPVELPAGGLIISAEDMAHYAIARLNEGRYGAMSILSPQGMAELHTPAISMGGAHGFDYYGLGSTLGTLDGIPTIAFAGMLHNFRSDLYLQPGEGWGVVLHVNAHGFEQAMQAEEITGGILSLLNGNLPAPVTLPFLSRFLYWTVLLTPLLQILGIAYTWRNWRNKGVGHILLTVIFYGGIASLWLFGVPPVTGGSIWPTIWFYYPELANGLIAGAALGIGWSVIFTAMNLKARRAK